VSASSFIRMLGAVCGSSYPSAPNLAALASILLERSPEIANEMIDRTRKRLSA